MRYWRMNTDKKARDDVNTYDLWYKFGMAFAGDHQDHKGEHAKIFQKLSCGDGIFMHVSILGIIGFGIVQEAWDEKIYTPSDSLVYNTGNPKEVYEYRIKVNWLPEYDRRRNSIKIAKLMPHMGAYNIIHEDKYDIQNILSKLLNNSVSNKIVDLFIDASEIIYEGASKEIVRTFYERNPDARKKCLALWGFDCCICAFNFEEYGSIGKNYIQVHHIVPISSYNEEHSIDPVNDLCPVCPNCHAMLHRKSPPYTIAEIKQKLYGKDNKL